MIEQVRLFEDPEEEIRSESEKPKIMDFIPEGRAAAVSMQYLALLLHTDERSIRKMVHDARIAGHIICSDECGYYLPVCAEDLTRWIHRAESSLISKSKALQPARQAEAEGRYPRTEAE